MPSEAEMRFVANLEDNTTPQLDRLEKKLRAMGASPAEIKMMLNAVDQASPKLADVQKQMDRMPKEHMIGIKATVDDAQAKIASLQKSVQDKPIQLKFIDNIQEIGDKLFNLRTRVNLPIGGALGGTGVGQVFGVGLAGAAAGGIGAAGMSLMQQGVQYNAQMEQSMVTLTQTLRDQSQARQEMGELVQFAQKTPFAYQDVMAADVRLRSYQIPTMAGEGGPGNKGWLSSAGDMAAAMSTPITQAVEAIADARQGYFIRMMSYGIRMMREDFQAGGKYAGLSYEQGIERAIRRFEGSMQMQSKTFQGTMSNLKDVFQQQILGPIGLQPFQAIKGVAQSAYSAMSDPKQLEKIGAVMEDIQQRQIKFFSTLKQGRILFEAHFQAPLQAILGDVIKIGQIFGQAFGGTTASVLKTVGAALFQVAGLVTNIASKMPGFVQFYGTMKALSLLGFSGIADPFLNLLKSMNPLTFSLRGILTSLVQMPGAMTKLGLAVIIKHFVDAHEASKAFQRQFKNMSELSFDKLNMQVDGLALRLGKAAYEMKNLSTFAGQSMQNAGLKGVGGGMRGAQLAMHAAEQATLLEQNFGFDPQTAITMMSDTFKARGTTVSTEAEDRFFNVLKQSTVGIQALGGSAEDVASVFATFRDSAAKIGLTGPGFTDELFAVRESLTNRMTNSQIAQFKNPDAMIQEMLIGTATPSVDLINQITKKGTNLGAINKFFSSKKFSQLPTKTNTIEDDHFAAIQAYISGDMPRSRYMKFLSGGLSSLPKFLDKPKDGPDKSSKLTDVQYSMDLIQSTYLANERAKKQSADAIKRIAPTVDLGKIQPQNPFLEKGMGVNIQPIRDASTAEQQVRMLGKAWLESSKHLDGLNSKIEAWQQNITATTGKQINYQNALDLVNAQMSRFQFDMTKANRVVEDASLALQKYQLAHVEPLQRQMEALNNEISKIGNNLQIAQHELGKYSEGLITGEQAVLNQLHTLDRFNKQLQLLQLNYQQMGADLGRTTYERGFSSRVEPIAGLSLQLQMERLQKQQQRKQLEYELSYGEQHYRLKQAGRSRFERMEMSFDDRLKGVKENTQATDRYTEAQYKLQRQQFGLSQAMYQVNREVQAQQRHLTELQIGVQEMQQSAGFRRLQDEQMMLQMHLDATNRKLNLQNQNLTQWQNLMDDLKNQKEILGETFAALTGAGGNTDTQKVKSMIDLWSQLPKAMGGITDAQKKEILRSLEQSQAAQASQRDKSLADYESWWDKVRQITSQGFIGLFTGQTWGALGQVIKTAVAQVFSSLGLPGGNLLGGGIGGALTLGGTAYSMFTGLRFASNMVTRGALSGAAGLASRFLPETHVANTLAGGLRTAGGMLGNNRAGQWFTAHGTGDLAGEAGDIAKWLKSLRPKFLDAFKLITALRTTIAGSMGGALGTVVGGPLGGIAGGLAGSIYGGNVPFRSWPLVGRPLGSMFPERVAEAASAASRPVRAAVEVMPDVKFVRGATSFAGGIAGFITKAFEFSGLGMLAKGLGKVGRIAGKAATISIPIFAALDLSTIIRGGKGSKEAAFSLGATGVGAGIGGALGLAGGPFAPITVPGGMLAGAAAGQLVGPLIPKINWGSVAKKILGGVKRIPKMLLDTITFAMFKAPAFLLGAYFALTIKLPFQIARKAVTEGWDLAKSIFSKASRWLGNAIGDIWDFFVKDSAAGARKAASKIPSIIENALGWMVNTLPGIIWRSIKSIGQMFIDAIGSLPGDVWDSFKGGLDVIPGFQTGIEKVQGNTIARLHEGEAVLNSAQANVWRQQRAGGSGAGLGYQIGVSQTAAVQGTFNSIESDWQKHLDKVQGLVKEHERSVVGINDVANSQIVTANKKGQTEVNDTIRGHYKAVRTQTRHHYGDVREKTEDGLKNTKKTVHHQLKDINDSFRNTGDVIRHNFKIPKLDIAGASGGPLSALKNAFGMDKQMTEDAKKLHETIAGLSNKQLRKLKAKFYDLPKNLRTPDARRVVDAMSDAFDRRTRAGHTSMSNNAQKAGARLAQMEDQPSDRREDKAQEVRRFWVDQEGKLHEQLGNVRRTAREKQEKDDEGQIKRQYSRHKSGWDGLNTLFSNKLDQANKTYDTGWSMIADTTSEWIDSVQELIKGIDEDLGLTKGKGKKHGKKAKGFAHGGLIKGGHVPKGQLIRVAEEGFDEVVVPLAPHRRNRAESLVKQIQGHLGGHGSGPKDHANGGFIQERIPGVDSAYTTAKAAYNAVRSFAQGGYVGGAQPPSGPQSSGIRALAAQMFAKGFSATSAGEYRGSGTYHDQQMALDFGDSVNNMKRLWSFLYPVRSKTLELFGPSYLGSQTLFDRGQAFTDAALQADHEDHIHVAVGQVIKQLGSVRGMGGAAGLLAKLGGKPLPKVPDKLKRMGALGKIVYSALKRKAAKWGGAAGAKISDVPSGGPRNWLTKALKITGHYSASNLDALYGRMMQESGGDPKAINLWDSNASAGTPSKGLLQTIDPTFNAYKMKGYGNIWNPIDNAIAAIRYMYSRYGHIVGPSGSGYAGGLPRVPRDNFLATLHKDEKVVPAGEANYERSGKRGRDAVSIAAKWDKTLEQVNAILEQIRKAKDHLKDIKDTDARREARERLQDLRNELAARRRIAAAQGKGFGYGIKRLLRKSKDRSGGEQTAKLVARERRKFKNMMKRAVSRAKRSKGYRKAGRQIKKARKAIRKMKRGGVTGKERQRIRRQKERIQSARQTQKKIIATAKRKARTQYLKGAAKRGINAALIKAITGKGLSKKERSWYTKAAKDRRKDSKDMKNNFLMLDKGANRRDKQRKAERAKAEKSHKAMEGKKEKAQKASEKARAAKDAKEKAMSHKELMKRDAQRAKDKAEAAKRRVNKESKQQKRQQHVDNRANKNHSRNDNFQKKSLELLKDIARKDLSVNVHNQSDGSFIKTAQISNAGRRSK